jgi:hypothetical protein
MNLQELEEDSSLSIRISHKLRDQEALVDKRPILEQVLLIQRIISQNQIKLLKILVQVKDS